MLESEKFIWSKIKNKDIPTTNDWNKHMNISYEEYIERLEFVNRSREQLKILKKNRGIKQKTEEWYNIRLNMLTASDTYAGIREYKSLIRKKALKNNVHFSSPALYWGVAFEPVACKLYSLLNNKVKVYEFGLIPYDEYENYGASPDGITELGIMLEIKCPITREIKDDSIPAPYYAQMQGQMAVCNLEECDFAEFAFEEINVVDFLQLDRKIFCGMIVEKEDGSFEYSRLKEDPNIAYMKHIDLSAKKIIYWKIKKYNIQRVKFDKELWYNDYLPKIKNFWKKVEEYEEPTYKYIDDDD